MLRKAKVVGKFVEFHGEGARALPATDRATIANMAPEYGATMGFFGVDEKTLEYYRATGRSDEHIETIKNYYKAQEMFGIPLKGEVDYTNVLELDLATITPAVAGPKRPQDRIELDKSERQIYRIFYKTRCRWRIRKKFGRTRKKFWRYNWRIHSRTCCRRRRTRLRNQFRCR